MIAFTTIPDSSIDADSVVDVALLTALRDNGNIGNLLNMTIITATNAAWNPDSRTQKMIVMVVGGGGVGGAGSAAGTGWSGGGGGAGCKQWGISTSVSGTYAATVGGSASNSSFIGTGISVTAVAGMTGKATCGGGNNGINGECNLGIGGVGGISTGNGGAAAANSGAGGGGGGANATTSGGAGGSGIIYIFEFS